MDCSSPRQVSYFGPFYIKNYSIGHQPANNEGQGRMEKLGTDERQRIDVSKYKIQTSTPQETTAPPPYSPEFSSPIYIDFEPEKGLPDNVEPINDKDYPIQDHVYEAVQPRKNNGQKGNNSKENSDSKDSNDYDTKGGNSKPQVKQSSSNGQENFSDKTCELKGMYEVPFKISSTEDNYMLDRFKSKSKLNRRNVIHQRSKSSEEQTSYQKATKQKEGSDFLSRHRRRIAKLKRRFFESQITMKPLSPPMVDQQQQTVDDLNADINNPDPDTDNEIDDSTSSKQDTELDPEQNTRQSNEQTIELETESKNDRNTSTDDNLSKERNRRYSAETIDVADFEALRMRWSTSEKEFAVVIAIDFGTTYSGYAYSFTHEPDTIHLMRRQESGEPGIFDQKIPTTILLTPEGAFHSFGYIARDFYNELEPKEATKWLYLDKFKMLLHNEGELRPDSTLRTVSGKEVSAMKIFSYSLAYFKNLAIQEISDQSGVTIATDVIRWVITVPAIWRASAKQFMRQAACEAGIVSSDRQDQLLIALEPEAASIYCRRLRLFHVLTSDQSADDNVSTADDGGKAADDRHTSSWSLPEMRENEVSLVSNDLQTGTRYMVVDCGGGTVDITVHEIVGEKRLKELQRASGGAHGSVGVDEEFIKLLGGIFGHDILDQFRRRRPTGWVEMMAMFESRKRTASPYRSSSISVPLPFAFIDFFKRCRGSSVESAVKKYGDRDVTWSSSGMLRLSPVVMRRLFRPTVARIKQAIGDVLNNPRLSDIQYMFLAGGFAESSMIQHELRKDFGPHLKIIIPPGVAMTVLKGAVSFGLDPDIVKSRCSCLTYGVGVLHRFDPQRHPARKKVTKDNVDWCTDVFDVFVRVNQSVELGESIVRRYTPVRRDQTATIINVYSTDDDSVSFVTDAGVQKCGTLRLKLSDGVPLGHRREIRTEMMFGDTEIRVRSIDVSGGETVEASIDFINI